MKSSVLQQGFSLLELMVVLLVIGIISAIAIISFSGSIDKSRRHEAQSVLHRLALQQEQYFTDNKVYADANEVSQWVEALDTNYYTYSLQEPAAGESSFGYVLEAQAVGAQAENDSDCETMTLNSIGQQVPVECWR